MPTLVRAPEELDNAVRESARRQGQSLNAWWLQAAEDRLQREFDIAEIVAEINADPVDREILNRLAE